MAIQIINCPACGTFLLDDTAECHTCGHILNADLAATTMRRSLPTDQAVDDDMETCAKCGESCRKGLVRCWNCGSFTRPEIEASYRNRVETLDTRSDNQFDLPELDSSSVTEADSMVRRPWSTPENLIGAPPMAREEDDGADDFELSDDVHMSDADDSSFDLADEIHLQSGETNNAPEANPVYSLQSNDLPPSAPAIPPVDHDMETIPLLGSPSTDAPALATESASPIPMSLPGMESNSRIAEAKSAASPEDELLKIAAAEEAEISQLRKGIRTKDTFVVFCPQGHRIRVREKFRGKSGKCPSCNSAFIVPQKPSPKPKKRTDVEIATVGAASDHVTGRYSRWLNDVHLHNVIPEKLKIKADSLLNDFQTVDLGFGSREILVVTLVAAGGLFGGAAKKKPAARTAMLEYFLNPDAAPEGLTVASKRIIAAAAFPQLVLAQPVPVGTDSMFGSIPIFGTGRIAVRLPRAADDKGTLYVSLSLSEFRAFALALQSVCGVEAFGSNSEIPMTDHYEVFKCHYSETQVRSLQQLEYYQKDPNFKLEISGWTCSACKLIVSEDARKKEKIGGLNGKGIAKAKCPKCGQKFGSNPMYAIQETTDAAPAGAGAEPPTDATAPEPAAAAEPASGT